MLQVYLKIKVYECNILFLHITIIAGYISEQISNNFAF